MDFSQSQLIIQQSYLIDTKWPVTRGASDLWIWCPLSPAVHDSFLLLDSCLHLSFLFNQNYQLLFKLPSIPPSHKQTTSFIPTSHHFLVSIESRYIYSYVLQNCSSINNFIWSATHPLSGMFKEVQFMTSKDSCGLLKHASSFFFFFFCLLMQKWQGGLFCGVLQMRVKKGCFQGKGIRNLV